MDFILQYFYQSHICRSTSLNVCTSRPRPINIKGAIFGVALQIWYRANWDRTKHGRTRQNARQIRPVHEVRATCAKNGSEKLLRCVVGLVSLPGSSPSQHHLFTCCSTTKMFRHVALRGAAQHKVCFWFVFLHFGILCKSLSFILYFVADFLQVLPHHIH